MNRTQTQTSFSAVTLDDAVRQQIVAALQKAYKMELETVANYLANSVFLDGMLAMEIKDSLAKDVLAELEHARLVAGRLKILGGRIPGSQELEATQTSLQPPADSIDLLSVIKGVIEAEEGAIAQYQQIIEMTGDKTDPVTQDLAINLKGDEEEHLREFVGFLREYEGLRRLIDQR